MARTSTEYQIDSAFDYFMDKLYDIDHEQLEGHSVFVKLIRDRLGSDVSDPYEEWWQEGED